MRATLAVIAAVTALAACASPPARGEGTDAEAAVAALEREVPLPDASRGLAGYERYYAVSGDRIEAVYRSSPLGSGRVHVVERPQLPQPQGGGCAVVNIVFDRTSRRFERILCNDVSLADYRPAPEVPATPASGGERG